MRKMRKMRKRKMRKRKAIQTQKLPQARAASSPPREIIAISIYGILTSYASAVIGLLFAHAILHSSRTNCLYMRRALVLLCLFVFLALPQAFASMADASTSPFQHAVAAGTTAVPALNADCPESAAHTGLPGERCEAEECDNDPITLYPSSHQGAPFCAIIWQAGPGALAEADARQATRPPRVRH